MWLDVIRIDIIISVVAWFHRVVREGKQLAGFWTGLVTVILIGFSSIVYRNEEQILASALDPQRTYHQVILPHKLDLYEEYVRTRTFWRDIAILLRTLCAVLVSRGNHKVD